MQRSGRSPAMTPARRSRRSTRSRSELESRCPVADEPTRDERQLIEELQAELAKVQVSELLLQTLYSVSSLGYHRVSGESKDLDQARLAIEALRALVPVLEGSVPPEALRDFNQ